MCRLARWRSGAARRRNVGVAGVVLAAVASLCSINGHVQTDGMWRQMYLRWRKQLLSSWLFDAFAWSLAYSVSAGDRIYWAVAFAVPKTACRYTPAAWAGVRSCCPRWMLAIASPKRWLWANGRQSLFSGRRVLRFCSTDGLPDRGSPCSDVARICWLGRGRSRLLLVPSAPEGCTREVAAARRFLFSADHRAACPCWLSLVVRLQTYERAT